MLALDNLWSEIAKMLKPSIILVQEPYLFRDKVKPDLINYVLYKLKICIESACVTIFNANKNLNLKAANHHYAHLASSSRAFTFFVGVPNLDDEENVLK